MTRAPRTFGERLAEARNARGMKQLELARKVGKGSRGPTISEWEKGKAQPDAEEVGQLLRVLRIDANWLLLGRGQMEIGGGGLEATPEEKLEAIDTIVGARVTADQLQRAMQNLEDVQLGEGIPGPSDQQLRVAGQ